MPKIKTLSALSKTLSESGSWSEQKAVTVTIDGKNLTIDGTQVAKGDSYFAVNFGGDVTVVFDLPTGSVKSTSAVTTADQADAIAKDLTGEPQEVKDAQAKASGIQLPALPKGYTWTLVGGKLTAVAAESGGSGMGKNGKTRVRRTKEQIEADNANKPPKVTPAVGLVYLRKKDGHDYKITKIEPQKDGKKGQLITLKPVGEGDKDLPTQAAPVPFGALFTHKS